MQFINKCFQKTKLTKRDILSKEITYCSHPTEEKFLQCTQEYVSKLLHVANKDDAEFLEIDQIVPSQNINGILRYFKDEIFFFVVDRDPRDVFASLKFDRTRVCPHNVEDFCKWYNYVRESGSIEKYDEKHVMKIHFEDLIYNYEDSVAKIEQQLGLNAERHINQFKRLNPKRSVHNTQIWTKHGLNMDDDIKIIEKECEKYLYPFENISKNVICGVDVKENSVF